MTNTTQSTAAGKRSSGKPVASERAGAVLAKGTDCSQAWRTACPAGVRGYLPALHHASAEARGLALALDGGGAELIAEIEGRCARTRRPLASR